jgi:predicted permease
MEGSQGLSKSNLAILGAIASCLIWFILFLFTQYFFTKVVAGNYKTFSRNSSMPNTSIIYSVWYYGSEK